MNEPWIWRWSFRDIALGDWTQNDLDFFRSQTDQPPPFLWVQAFVFMYSHVTKVFGDNRESFLLYESFMFFD